MTYYGATDGNIQSELYGSERYRFESIKVWAPCSAHWKKTTNRQLKHLEVLIRFLRFPECPFLLHGVEHSVAILSLVLVRETDDRQLSVILFYVYKS